jgi:hypothetical protein
MAGAFVVADGIGVQESVSPFTAGFGRIVEMLLRILVRPEKHRP